MSAAILDHALGDGDSETLCKRLKERGIPFVNYTGMPDLEGACHDAPTIPKPADPYVLVDTVADLLSAA